MPPTRPPSEILAELRDGKISLREILNYANAEMQRRLDNPRMELEPAARNFGYWVDYAKHLGELSNDATALRVSNREGALGSARCLLILSRICFQPSLKIQCLRGLGFFFREEKALFEAVEALQQLVEALHAESLTSTCGKAPELDALYPKLHLDLLQYLVEALIERGDYEEALTRSLELSARARWRDQADRALRADTRRAYIYAKLGEYERVRECLNWDALLLTKDGPIDVSEQQNIAILARDEGRFEEAISILVNVLENTEERELLPPRPIIRSELGFTYVNSGNYTAAIRELELAADEFDQPTLSEYWRAFNPRDVSEYWRERAASMRAMMDPASVGEFLDSETQKRPFIESEVSRAELLQRSDDPENWLRARAIYRNALSDDSISEQHKCTVLINLALLCNHIRDNCGPGESIECKADTGVRREQEADEADIANAQEAVSLADKIALPLYKVRSRLALATIFFNRDLYPECMSVVKAGLSTVDELMSDNEDSESRQQILAQARRLIELALVINTRSEAPPLRPLWIAEQRRARNMSRWFRLESWADRVSKRSDVAEQAIIEELRGLRAIEVGLEVIHYTGQFALDKFERYRYSRRAARARLDQRARDVNVETFDWKSYFHEKTFGTLEAQLASLQNLAVVSLASAQSAVCVSILSVLDNNITARNWRHHCLPTEFAQATAASSQFGMLDRTDSRRNSRQRAFVVNEAGEATKEFETRWEWLCRSISHELRETKQTRIAIIPDSEFGLFPFWSILDKSPGIEEMIVTPSLDVLLGCRARIRQESGPTAVVGDITNTLGLVEAEVELVRSARAGDEVRQNFRSHRDFVLAAAKCSLLHIAGHGNFYPQNPYDSGVPVTMDLGKESDFARFVSWPKFDPSPEPGPGKFRLMTVASAMAELTLENCRLAVLSTCESGIPRVHDGGESLGLPNALLIAGAKSVIASHWKVDDRAAFLLMKYFYETWSGGIGQEVSVAKSLARARRQLQETTREEATAALGSLTSPLPPGERPFLSPIYSNAFHCFGSW
jgi:CHAT domain-containing protein/tetratricopeptide (TPR) repeat protein